MTEYLEEEYNALKELYDSEITTEKQKHALFNAMVFICSIDVGICKHCYYRRHYETEENRQKLLARLTRLEELEDTNRKKLDADGNEVPE